MEFFKVNEQLTPQKIEKIEALEVSLSLLGYIYSKLATLSVIIKLPNTLVLFYICQEKNKLYTLENLRDNTITTNLQFDELINLLLKLL